MTASAVGFTTRPAAAQADGEWLLTDYGTFENAASWSSNPLVPDGVIRFSGGAGGGVYSSGTFNVAEIVFDSPTSTSFASGAIRLSSGIIDSEHVNGDSSGNLGANFFNTLSPEIASVLSGANGLTKNGPGAVALYGANVFSGTVAVNAGTLQIAADTALASPANNVVLNGTALRVLSDRRSIGILHPVMLAAGKESTIGGMAVLNGAISGSGNLHLTGEGQTLTAANTCSGTIRISGASQTGVTLTDFGSLLKTSDIRVFGSQLVISNASVVPAGGRIADNANLSLHSGTLALEGNANTGYHEVIQSLSLDGGSNTLRLAAPSNAEVALDFKSMSRNSHATLAITAPTLGSSDISGPALYVANIGSLLSGAGGSSGTTRMSILPFAVENGTFSNQQLLTATGSSLRPLNSATEYETNTTNWTSSSNAKLTANATLPAPASVNALLNNASTLDGAGTLRIGSGLVAGNGTISCPLDFGAHEGVILSTHVTSPISGSAGVTYDLLGGGVPMVTLNNASTYSGPTTLSGGTFVVNASVSSTAPGPFGLDASPIVLTGGTTPAAIRSTSAITVSRPLTADAPLDALAINSPLLEGNFNVTGAITLSGPLRLANAINVSGNITGPGTLFATAGSSNITLSGNNSYTGGTMLRSGTLTLGSNSALGSGTLTLGGSCALVAQNGSHTIPNAIMFDPLGVIGYAPGTLTIPASSSQIILTGSTDIGTSELHVNVLNSSDVMAGSFNNGTLVKDGSGTLYGGQFNLISLRVNSGKLVLPIDAVASRTATLYVASGAQLILGSHGMAVNYHDNSFPIDSIRNYLLSGQLTGSNLITGVTGVGYADNTLLNQSTFGGTLVPHNSVLIGETYLGDTNLDGKVDIDDLGNLAAHWQQTGYWSGGDFNYDGTINIVDLGLLAGNWQAGGTNATALSFQQAMTDVGFKDILVPEPAVLGGGVLVLCSLRRRRSASMGICS